VVVATEDTQPYIPVGDVFPTFTMAPLPEGASAEAVYMLIKLADGDWCARTVGDTYNRLEFLGQLTAYTHGLTMAEASGWFEEAAEE
jgi:hypothetical protein